MRSLAIILFSLLLAGCDTMYGIYRRAPVPAVPDMAAIKARIESYPEIEKVEYKQFGSGSQPITLTGLKKEDEIFQIHYVGGSLVRGYLVFERDYKGRVTYRQYLISMNRRVPQEWVDATWPVMKKIEADLITLFGLSGITEKLEAGYHGGEDPERKPIHPPQTTTGPATCTTSCSSSFAEPPGFSPAVTQPFLPVLPPRPAATARLNPRSRLALPLTNWVANPMRFPMTQPPPWEIEHQPLGPATT